MIGDSKDILSINVSTIYSIKPCHQSVRFTPETTFKRTGIGRGTDLKRMIIHDMRIIIDQIIITRMIITGKIIGCTTIIDKMIIGAMTGIVTIDEKMINKIIINAIVKILMIGTIHSSGIAIIATLLGWSVPGGQKIS